MSHPVYKPPPPAFCTKAKIAKGGAYLRDTTVLHMLQNKAKEKHNGVHVA